MLNTVLYISASVHSLDSGMLSVSDGVLFVNRTISLSLFVVDGKSTVAPTPKKACIPKSGNARFCLVGATILE